MKKNKKLFGIVASVLVIALSVITVTAYLFINSGLVTNSFEAAESTDPAVSEEKFDGTVKENVSVNVGDPGYAVYVRAAIVVTWKSEDGSKVLGDKPVLDTDYTMELNVGDDKPWFLGSDGFYYHKSPVNSGNTSVLIDSASPIDSKTMTYDGKIYYLSIDIASQTIQALGTTDDGDIPAVVDAWHVTMTGDLITGPVATD